MHNHIYAYTVDFMSGHVLIAHNTQAICAVFLAPSTRTLHHQLHESFKYYTISTSSTLSPLAEQVLHYIHHPYAPCTLPLQYNGTPFQRMVWQALQQVPYGTTMTYSQLAQMIARPTAVRAVASACAANTLAILIPCHRVIAKNNSLAGYRWGIEYKQALLTREADTHPPPANKALAI